MSVFLKACRAEPTEYTPVWLMRQAGRYQPEYRELRSRVSFLQLCKTPELACEVTVRAVEQLGVDAGIIFADILLLLEPLRVGFKFTDDRGPQIDDPIRTAAQVDAVASDVDVAAALSYVCDAIKLTKQNLSVPLIGFAGAPFTLASYMIEGGGSKNYLQTKRFMYSDEGKWHALMTKISDAITSYLNAQIDAGADAVQLFDSWVGCLSADDYAKFVQPHVKRVFDALDTRVPSIHFGTGNPSLYPLMREAGGDVIGVDWRVGLDEAWRAVGHDRALMGNLDPGALLAPVDVMCARADDVLRRAQPTGHIFTWDTASCLRRRSTKRGGWSTRPTRIRTRWLAMRVLVVGGGLAGLTAAYRLKQARPDLEVRVFEASDRPGGLIRTERTGDLAVERGPTRSLRTSRRRLNWRAILGSTTRSSGPTRQTAAPMSSAVARLSGSPLAFRLWELQISMRLSLRLSCRRKAKSAPPRTDDRAHQRRRRREPSRLCHAALRCRGSAAVGATGGRGHLRCRPCEAQHESGARKVLRARKASGQCDRGPQAAATRPSQRSPRCAVRLFMSFVGGMQTLTDALVSEVGASVSLNAPVQNIARTSEGRWSIDVNGEQHVGDALIVAVPAWRASELPAFA